MSEQTQNTHARNQPDGLVVGKDGAKRWYQNGSLHREDGPAIEYADGTKAWYFYGEMHREGGPAYEGANGHREWWCLDKLHRTDGPAVVRPDGSVEWRIGGMELSTEEIEAIIKREAVKVAAEVHKGIDEDITPAPPVQFRKPAATPRI